MHGEDVDGYHDVETTRVQRRLVYTVKKMFYSHTIHIFKTILQRDFMENASQASTHRHRKLSHVDDIMAIEILWLYVD